MPPRFAPVPRPLNRRRRSTAAAAAGPAAGRAAFGANKFKQVPPKSFFLLWFGNLKDPTLIMLMAAALVRRLRSPRRACCAWLSRAAALRSR